jgi:hypothetical protein
MKWIDLSSHKVALIPTKLNDGRMALVIIGENAKADSKFKEGLRGLHFIPSPKGFWFSTKYSTPEGKLKGISVSSFKACFPDAKVKEMTTDEVSTGHVQKPVDSEKDLGNNSANVTPKQPVSKNKTNETRISAKEAKDIEVNLNQIKPIGINELNEKVYQSAGDRFVVDSTNARVFEKSGFFASPRYLRAGRPTSIDGAALSSCMYGLVHQVKNGGVLSQADIENSAKVFFDIKDWDAMNEATTNSISKFIQIAIESAIVKEVESGVHTYADTRGKVALEAEAMYERRPTLNNKDAWHRDLPPDISLMVGDLLLEDHNKILLPFANQGSNILSVVQSAGQKPVRALMDAGTPSFSSHFGIGKDLNISFDKFNYNKDNLADKSVDFIVGAMPASSDRQARLIDSGETTRRDHYYAFKILNSLRENGRAIITVEADGFNGEVTEESTVFMQWLYENYKVDSVVDLDGGLYSRSGDYGASRLIVINGRHLVPIKANIPNSFDVMHKRSDVIAHIDVIKERLDGLKHEYQNDDTLDTETLSQAMSRIQQSRGEEIQINEFQGRYISMSSIGEVASMVPKNFSDPIRMCFARFMKDEGTVDAFVQEKLQMTEEEMFIAFGPEQIDSIGLAIWRNETQNKGFLIGDQTGKGKGRIIAGLMRYAAIEGKKTLFLTKDADLFQDIWRDIQDIGSENLFKPYLVNNNSVIYDNEGSVIAKGSNRDNAVYIDNDSAPNNNLIMTSYSQLSSKPKTEKINGVIYTKPNKPDWHKTLAKDAFMILDESHLAAGKSNTNKVVDDMLDRCSGIAYSSATYSRHAKSMAIYRKLFPEQLSTKDIEDALVKGKEPLQEILSATLVADGGMLRREHDLSRLTMNVAKATSYKERNEEACDAFAKFLSGFAMLTGDIEGAAESINKQMINNIIKQQTVKGNTSIKIPSSRDIGYQSMSFGSQLHNLTKQFVLALNVDAGADEAIKSIQQGRKPVLGIENTGESLLKHIKELNEDDTFFETMPSIRDLLKRVVQRNMMVSYINPLNNRRSFRSASELFKDPAKAQYVEAQIKSLMDDIDNIPALPFSPLDTLISKLEGAGLKVGEISGRKLHVNKTEKGYTISSKKKADKNAVVSSFNEGYLDCVVTTKSGATGISMHASEKFADQNQRELIEIQIFDDIIDRVQLLGRVNRKGQVVDPVLSSIDSLVPGQTRLLAMANTKLARLSANTTANRDNSAQLDTIDILNNVGDTVCQRYLESNPNLRKRLYLKENDIEDKNLQKGYENSLSRVVTSRLLLLPVADQRAVYSDLDFEFDAYIRECESQGYNPLKRRELDVKATETNRQRLSGASKTFYESEFDRPVEIVTIEYDIHRKALDADSVATMIENGSRRVYQDPRVDIDDECLFGLTELVEQNKRSLLEETFEDGFGFSFINYTEKEYNEKLKERLEGKHLNSTKKMNEMIEWTKEKLELINIGTLIEFSSYFSDVKGVIVDIRLPRAGSEHMLAQYELSIATPKDGVIIRSLADLYQGSKVIITAEEFETDNGLAGEFNRSTGESFKTERYLLAGNMFEAARFSAAKKIGSPVIYTDTSGARLPAVLLAGDMTPTKLLQMPFTLDKPSLVGDYLRCHENTKLCNSLEYKYTKDIIIMRDSKDKSRWKVTVPNNKSSGERFFASTQITNHTVNGWHVNARNQVAQVTDKELNNFISQVYTTGVRLFTPKNARAWVNDYDEGKIKVPNIGQSINSTMSATNSMTPA